MASNAIRIKPGLRSSGSRSIRLGNREYREENWRRCLWPNSFHRDYKVMVLRSLLDKIREQFEVRTHKRLLDIRTYPADG
jgi:hypothetical protein